MTFATAVLAASFAAPAAAGDAFLGRWNVHITDAPDTFAGAWFKVERMDDGLAAWLVWKWGSVEPATTVEVEGGTLRLVREGKDGRADVFEAHLQGDLLEGEAHEADGTRRHFQGRRAPELETAAAPRWGRPVTLFDGRSLNGWRARDPLKKMGWAVVDGEAAVVDPKDNSDLVSEATFRDFKLHLEFNVEPHGNSGVYLRGRYEVQILDDRSLATAVNGCGAVYSRIAPMVDAARAPGEWQAFDITFVGRRLTVVLNGRTIVDDAYVDGITGGALDPFEDAPGPLMLQGDHGQIRFRNIVVTPAE